MISRIFTTKNVNIPVIGAKCSVLNHGHVILTDAMPSYIDPTDPLGAERKILDAARTSTNLDSVTKKNKGILNGPIKYDYDRDVKLLKYLMKHQHWSPFEQIQLQFHLRLPMFVRSQYIRYRTGAYNEESRRYSLPTPQFYVPEKNKLLLQSTTNKQASSNEIINDEGIKLFYDTLAKSEEIYQTSEMLTKEYGLSRETARLPHPQNMFTSLVLSMNLRNVLNVIAQRTHSTAQYEARVYAFAIYNLVKQIAPITLETFLNTHMFNISAPIDAYTEVNNLDDKQDTINNKKYIIAHEIIKDQIIEIEKLKEDFKSMTPVIEYEQN